MGARVHSAMKLSAWVNICAAMALSPCALVFVILPSTSSDPGALIKNSTSARCARARLTRCFAACMGACRLSKRHITGGCAARLTDARNVAYTQRTAEFVHDRALRVDDVELRHAQGALLLDLPHRWLRHHTCALMALTRFGSRPRANSVFRDMEVLGKTLLA